jgi:hypothetical protein
VATDVSLMKFQGWLSSIQFGPLNRTQFQAKFYKLCESDSGYWVGFKVYTGQDTVAGSNESLWKHCDDTVWTSH